MDSRILDTGYGMADLHNLALRMTIEAPSATLASDGEFFVMHGASGTHRLAVKSTNAKRLWTHWQGFKQIAKAA